MANQQKEFSTGANPPRETTAASTPGTTGAAGGATGAAAATARGIIDQAKETAGQAYEVVTDKATTTLEQKKTTLSEGLNTVADNIRKLGENLGGGLSENPLTGVTARYSSTAAQRIQDVARYFEQHDVRQMVRDVERFARRNPAVFLGAAFGIGLLAARFLKASPNKYQFSGGRGHESLGANLPEIESGQGIQMSDEEFLSAERGTPAPNLGAGSTTGTTAPAMGSTGASPTGEQGAAGSIPTRTAGTRKRTGGSTARNTGTTPNQP